MAILREYRSNRQLLYIQTQESVELFRCHWGWSTGSQLVISVLAHALVFAKDIQFSSLYVD